MRTKSLAVKPKWISILGKYMGRLEDNIKLDLKEIGYYKNVN
jgi:hypothetical protein